MNNTNVTNAMQIEEAIKRMKKIKLHHNVINEFINGKLNLSEHAMLFWLDDAENEMVRNWEKETGNVVYHVIKNNLEFGLCYSFLYVSKYPEDWDRDDYDIDDGVVFAYVRNATDEYCSEYGLICIKPCFGGVLRTA